MLINWPHRVLFQCLNLHESVSIVTTEVKAFHLFFANQIKVNPAATGNIGIKHDPMIIDCIKVVSDTLWRNSNLSVLPSNISIRTINVDNETKRVADMSIQPMDWIYFINYTTAPVILLLEILY